MSEQGGHHYLKSHQLSGEVLQLDLQEEQRQILEAAKLREHKAEGPVAIQALQGSTRITSTGDPEDLEVGGMLVFGGGVSHSVEAKTDSVLLLTVAMASA